MRGSTLGFSFLKLRDFVAIVVLLSIVSLAPFATIFFNSVQTNFVVALAQVIFFVATFRFSVKTIREIILDAENLKVSLFVISALSLVLVSLISNEGSERSFFYIANVLFFFSLVWLFLNFNDVLKYIFFSKILSVFLTCLIFICARFYQGESFYDDVFLHPVIYRHLRHLNYDLMIGMGSILLLVALGWFRSVPFYFIVFVFSVLIIWTGGRGQFVALLIFVFLLLFSKFRKLAVSVLAVLVLAFAVVVASGETKFLFGQMEKTLESTNANGVSSGRLRMWSDALEEGLTGGFLGHGADSYREFNPDYFVHPHNSVVQFLFEYGVAGFALCFLFFCWTALFSIRLILDKRSSSNLKVLSSFVLSMYAYSLVDGIFYHAIPFSFMIIIAAVFFVELRRRNSRGSAVDDVDSWVEKSLAG